MTLSELKLKTLASARLLTVALAMAICLPSILVSYAQKPAKTSTRPAPKKVQRPEPGKKMVNPTIPKADRNQANKVFLEYADRLSYQADPQVPAEDQYQIVSGNVKLRKGGMFMYCDSAYVYEKINSVEAFGNVRMEQGDTLFVYADYLDYDGLNQEAVLYADAGKKVRLRNRDVTLTTDVFHYDLVSEVGFYDVGGELTDNQNKLTSWEGEYYSRTKQSYFTGDVHLTSRRKNDVLFITTDSLEYNTATHIAQLVSESTIRNKDGIITTTSGVYNTNSGVADLYERSTVVTERGNTLTGDTLIYDRQKQQGWAYGNMVLTDSARQSSLLGDYGFYDELRDSAFVTGRALAKEYSKGDTLYLHGDTIEAYLDLSDSTKVTNAYHRVRFYRFDIQGLCDSLSLTERDSMMWMYRAPIVWSGERQILGNQINVHLADSTVDWARLPRTGLMAEHIAEDCYNQLSGDDMTTWMNDSTVRRLYAEGSVQLIVFPMESDSTYNKYAYIESSYMDAYFNNNSVESIHFWPETTSKITPLYLAKRNSYFLPKFRWYEDLRPISPEDVFYLPDGMELLLSSAPPVQSGPSGPGEPKRDVGEPNPNAPADRIVPELDGDDMPTPKHQRSDETPRLGRSPRAMSPGASGPSVVGRKKIGQ
ncbi:MAG: LPS export ABC transporter periplasmic protein LptC [Bacteroides sp.]|nr:LPS export ABC transporter periplasmic protein LptC [Bacteroides sp.]MCM1413944.1 LPS export ABC transporter periplasmic protein LptC [Bacteroides sp.]MCM1471629.1 LPS export ABC transporter periplasmic protein LptC [Bacteroides sp.]